MEVVSAFPLPPPYYKNTNLQPPPLPSEADQSISVFGEQLCIHTSLETPSIAQFVDQVSSSLATAHASFKALVRLVVAGKASVTAIQQHIQSIKESFLAAHNAINEQRKIEALSQIIASLKQRIEAKQQMIKQIDWKIKHQASEIFAPYTKIASPAAFEGQTFEEAMHQRINEALINAQE